MNNKKSIFLTVIIVVIIFVISLYALNKQGYISFNHKSNQSSQKVNIIDDNNKEKDISNNDTIPENTISNSSTQDDDIIKKANTNMTNDEVFDLWKKIKGNWAAVEYKNDLCTGLAVEINYFIKFAKFNSDGITSWSVVSYEKINQNQYKVNLITPVDLINQMSGDVVAHYSSIIIDTSKISEKVIRIYNNDSYVDYDYVGENNGEVKNFQYIDGGLKQDEYCKWYKENH